MLNTKTYSCGICKTNPDQISHHKSHIETQKHKDKKEVFELKLSKLTDEELEEKYNTSNVDEIVEETETIIYNKKLKPNHSTEETDITTEMMALKTAAIEETDITTEMMDLKTTAIEESNSISNREALKDKIHEIHNYLRNNGAGYGMSALKVFNILYGLKKIEEKKLIDVVNLKRPDCEFSYLLHLAEQNEECEKLSEILLGSCLVSISKSSIRELLFYRIPQNIKGSVFAYLIKEINKITLIEKTCNVLLSGKIYEYFIGRDESAISELGAYFTDRHIVDYILQKLNPSVNEDGTISSMVDMFGGSGGFTTGYINYLNEQEQLVNWNTEINKISHFDMNEDVIKSAGLEIFSLTGVLPNMNNLKYKNSFADDFDGQKYKYILTNPPYGGDKNKKTETQNKREKVKYFIKKELLTITDEALRKTREEQLKKIEAEEKQEKKEGDKAKVSVSTCSSRIQTFAKNNSLKGNDKESCSLMMLMDMLEIEGTAIGVLKEGVFFNRTYKDLRKFLVENFNVREVISVPQDQFENTSTKTSIVIFDNTQEKTSEVIFSDLIVHRYEEDKFGEVFGDIVILENQGDIKGISDVLISQGSKEEILGNVICSLNGKDYGKKEILVGEGYELVKLESICEFCPKSKRNASFGELTGQYNFYTSSDKVQKCNIADYNEECLIIGDGGVANIKKDNNFSCSDHNHIVKTKYNSYIYYLLSGKIELLSNGFSGSVLKNLSINYLKNLQIPIPTSQSKLQEWVNQISAPYNEKNAKQTQIKELEDFIQHRIREIGENEECEEVELGSVLKYVSKKNKYRATDGQNQGKYRFYTSSQDKVLYRDDYEFENNHILIGRGGVASLHLSSNFSVSHDDVYVLTIQNPKYDLIYIYNYIKNNIQLIQDSFKGSTIKHSSKTALSQIKIKIPKNKQIIQELESIFQQIETLQNEVKVAEDLYKQLIQELSQESIPQEKKNVKEIANIKVEKTPPMEEEKMSQKAEPKTKKPKKEKEEKKTTKTKKPKKETEEKKKEPIKKKPKFVILDDEELVDHTQSI